MHLNQRKPPGNRVNHFQESEGDTVPSGSPAQQCSPERGKMAEGGVPLRQGQGQFYFVILGNAICSHATYLPMLKKEVCC